MVGTRTTRTFLVASVGLLLAAALAGCASGPTTPSADAAPPGGPGERPDWTAVAPGPAEPMLRDGSGFVATEWGFVAKDWIPPTQAEPTIVSIDGYGGASVPVPTHYLRVRDGTLVAMHILPADRQVVVEGTTVLRFPGYTQLRASIRGTGCSGGAFSLFDEAAALDGRDIIQWVAAQTWTTPKVGLHGGSYGGLSAFYVAATQPPNLAAVGANMLVDDYYRGIAYPGGVLNNVFPVVWPVARPVAGDSQGAVSGGEAMDEICGQNVARRPRDSPEVPTSVILAATPYDEGWFPRFSLYQYASRVRAPISIAHSWQDEQTGPRGGPRVFDLVSPDPIVVDGQEVVPKRLVTTNGGHGTAYFAAHWHDVRWFDALLKGVDNGALPGPPVLVQLNTQVEMVADDANFTWGASGLRVRSDAIHLDAFPATDTAWVRFHLRTGGALTVEAPAGAEPTDPYVTGSPRRSWDTGGTEMRNDGPDVAHYGTSPLGEAVVVAGPVAARLFVETTVPDMDLFVAVADEHPDGSLTYLARGMLRASHRAIDEARSLYTPSGEMMLPHHPHAASEPVPVGEIVTYDIEVFPFAHIFYAGHRIRIEVSTPPLMDGQWGYSPLRLVGVNSIHHGSDTPSSILLPTITWPGGSPAELPCGAPAGYGCVPPPS